MRLVLASRSPQRRAILEQLGVPYTVLTAAVDELLEGDPAEVARENARRKALAVVSAPEAAGAAVLGVDTIVVVDGRILGKPADEAQARAFLSALAGRTHSVLSGVAVAAAGAVRDRVARTAVTLRPLSSRDIDWYLATQEWRQRAGGYAIQGRGAALVERIEGDYLNVVGLPVPDLLALLPDVLHERR